MGRAWDMVNRECCPVYANANIDPSREVFAPVRVDLMNAAERVVERLIAERDGARQKALRDVRDMLFLEHRKELGMIVGGTEVERVVTKIFAQFIKRVEAME